MSQIIVYLTPNLQSSIPDKKNNGLLSMSKENEWGEVIDTLRVFIIWSITSIIDTSFLALWVAVQWLVGNQVIKPLKLSGIDQIVLIIFQILFAISTLAPVAITIYRDIRIMIIRTQRKIKEEVITGDSQE
jgi:hypothetical protein